MRLILYLYFVCYFSPYMFQALTGPSSGVSLTVIMLPFRSCSVIDCSCVRGGGLVVRQGHLHGRTDSKQARQEPNGSIATAKETPDDGPVKARDM
jgi:hypothetical protein